MKFRVDLFGLNAYAFSFRKRSISLRCGIAGAVPIFVTESAPTALPNRAASKMSFPSARGGCACGSGEEGWGGNGLALQTHYECGQYGKVSSFCKLLIDDPFLIVGLLGLVICLVYQQFFDSF